MNKQCTLAAALAGSLIIAPAALSHAQQAETDSARAVRHNAAVASLAKAAHNPVANMVSLPLQHNFYTSTAMVLNVHSRTMVPFVRIPLQTGRQSGGIADIQEQAYFTSAKPGRITWAVGPIFSFPTATNAVARTGQWGLGPTAVALAMPGHWVIGTLVNNVWRIRGAAHGDVLNTFTVQPFINYNLPRAWAISTAPLITSNWSAAEGERWTFPVGMGVSKVTHVMEQPLNLELQYYHALKHPSRAGAEQVRLEVAALWPTAAAEAARKKEAVVAAKEKNKKPEQD